jgi:hypothetical protein
MAMDRLQVLEAEYKKMFKDVFPRYLFIEYSDEEMAILMEKCIEQKKTPQEITGRDYEPCGKY